MIFKQLEILLARLDFSKELSNPFEYQVRPLLSYLERKLAQEKIKAEYNRVVITLVKSDYYPPMLHDKTIQVCVRNKISEYEKFPLKELNSFLNKGLDAKTPKKMKDFQTTSFPQDSFNQIPVEELNEYFISLLNEGVSVASKCFSIPQNIFIEAINEFRDNRYKNQWVIKSKTIKNRKYKISIEGELRVSDFFATIKLHKGNEVLFTDTMLRMPPSEFAFQPYIKKVEIEEVSPKEIFIDLGGHLYQKDLSDYFQD